MKILRSSFTILLVIFLNEISFGRVIDSLYEVGTWKDFRSGAVSFTFDDNCSNQTAIALPMFDQYGYKMTFFSVINWGPNWSKLQSAVNNGHEVGSHTMTHTSLNTLSTGDQTNELKNSQDAINSHITGQKCVTIAYPNCLEGDGVLCGQYYLAARGCSGVVESSTPADFMNISSFVCGDQGSIKTPQDFKTKADVAASSKGWVVFLIHGIDNDGGYSPVTSTNLHGALDSLAAHSEKYWIATFGTVARYVKERNDVSIIETSVTDSCITLSAEHTLDSAMYSIPLTIRRQMPDAWSSVVAMQAGKVVRDTIVEINSKRYVMFDVVPNGGEITLSASSVTGITLSKNSPLSLTLQQNFPNPFNPTTTISFSLPQRSTVRLVLMNVLGQAVKEIATGDFAAGSHRITLDASGLASGIYFYRLEAGTFVNVKKLILLK